MRTKPGDLVLIHHRETPQTYARVEEILADQKPGWWQVRLLLLTLPSREVTWILRDEYVDGDEFTMGGEPIRLAPVPPPVERSPEGPGDDHQPEGPGDDHPPEGVGTDAKVVSLAQRRKRR